jgi:Gliding motility associated protein GldN
MGRRSARHQVRKKMRKRPVSFPIALHSPFETPEKESRNLTRKISLTSTTKDMKAYQLFLATTALMISSSAVSAQVPGYRVPPRTDDHFQRDLVLSRIDLTEKINLPLVSAMSLDLYTPGANTEYRGVVAALINGLKTGKYLAHDPDDLSVLLTYEDALARSQQFNGVDEVEDPEWIDEPDPEWIEEEDINIEQDNENSGNNGFDGLAGGEGDADPEIALAPLESVLEIIENRIFDKNRSAEIYDMQYIRIVWVDPGETLPDKNFICFKYSDIVETLEATRWANRHNDAEDRNLREIFEERIYNGYVLNVRDSYARTKEQSAFRAQQLVEFEHHLWQF